MGEYDQHTPAEYKARFPYLKEVDSFALLNAQLDVENAFANHRKDPGHFGYPNFRAKHFSKKSYTTTREIAATLQGGQVNHGIN